MTADVEHEIHVVASVEPARKLTDQRRRRWRGGALFDLLCVGGYLLAAVAIMGHLWVNLGHGYLAKAWQDQHLFEWFFAVTAQSVASGDNPLFTTLQNYPLGVNLMANTAMLGLTVPLTPVTLLFGPTVAWAVVLTGGLAGTAITWYWVLSRHLLRSRPAAVIGGVFCAFAPPVISHANGHPNFVVLFVFPLIVLQLIHIWRGRKVIRSGVLLGLLIAFQIVIGEESLLFAATGLVTYGIAYAIIQPAAARVAVRSLITGLGVAAAVSFALMAYPLWWQFFGPQSYRGVDQGVLRNDVVSFMLPGSESLAGSDAIVPSLVPNYIEENSFFGASLLVLVVGLVIWLWRLAEVRALAITTLVMAVLSLGAEAVFKGRLTGIPLPWRFLRELPPYTMAMEGRLTLVCVPLIGLLLARGTERVLAATQVARERRTPLRLLWFTAVVAALLPIAPTPLPVVDRPVTPRFFADGTWHQYIVDGGTLVPVPLPTPEDARQLHWQIDAGFGFSLPGGYFMGPRSTTERIGVVHPLPRPTARLLSDVAAGKAVPVDDAARRAALEDLRYWHADLLVLWNGWFNQAALRSTVQQLLGPGQQVSDVWLWDVHALTH